MKRYKVIILGDYGVGKTSITDQFLYARFDKSYSVTIGIEYGVKKMDNGTIFDVWDTAGQERFRNIVRGYFRKVDVLIMVFDRTEPCTMENIDHWLKEYEQFGDGSTPLCKILLGNKSDLRTIISEEEGEGFAKKRGFDAFFNVSATRNDEIGHVFDFVKDTLENRSPNNSILSGSVLDVFSLQRSDEKDSSSSRKISCCGI